MSKCVVRPAMFCIALAALPLRLPAQSDVAFPPEVYAARRARLVEAVDGAPVIIPGRYMIRSGGQSKQDPNFWYLTGVESPYAILVISGDEGGRKREVLFLPRRYQFAGAQYPMAEPRFRGAAWNQPIRWLSPGRDAELATGIAETYPVDEFAERLPEIVGDAQTVYFASEGGRLYAPPGLGEPLSYRQQLGGCYQAAIRQGMEEPNAVH